MSRRRPRLHVIAATVVLVLTLGYGAVEIHTQRARAERAEASASHYAQIVADESWTALAEQAIGDPATVFRYLANVLSSHVGTKVHDVAARQLVMMGEDPAQLPERGAALHGWLAVRAAALE